MSESTFSPAKSREAVNPSALQESGTHKKVDSNEQLRQNFAGIIDELNLTNLQKEFLRLRWLEQVMWMEKRGRKARAWYHRLRLVSIIGGIILPGLVTLSVNKAKDETLSTWLYLSTFGLSQIVVISTATEQLFSYGERWVHYRRSAESLKTQGWQFFQLSGPYVNYKSDGAHQAAFNVFVSQVEDVIQRDVEVYTTQTMQKRNEEKKADQNPADVKTNL